MVFGLGGGKAAVEHARKEVLFWKSELDHAVAEKNAWKERFLAAHRNASLFERAVRRLEHERAQAAWERDALAARASPAGGRRGEGGSVAASPSQSGTGVAAAPSSGSGTSSGRSSHGARGTGGANSNADENPLGAARAALRAAGVRIALLEERALGLARERDDARQAAALAAEVEAAVKREATVLRDELSKTDAFSAATADETTKLLLENSRLQQANAALRADAVHKDAVLRLLEEQVAELTAALEGGSGGGNGAAGTAAASSGSALALSGARARGGAAAAAACSSGSVGGADSPPGGAASARSSSAGGGGGGGSSGLGAPAQWVVESGGGGGGECSGGALSDAPLAGSPTNLRSARSTAAAGSAPPTARGDTPLPLPAATPSIEESPEPAGADGGCGGGGGDQTDPSCASSSSSGGHHAESEASRCASPPAPSSDERAAQRVSDARASADDAAAGGGDALGSGRSGASSARGDTAQGPDTSAAGKERRRKERARSAAVERLAKSVSRSRELAAASSGGQAADGGAGAAAAIAAAAAGKAAAVRVASILRSLSRA